MKKTILIGVIVLGFFLRFYQLNSYPALNADEAALGYNAYSLLQTGKDEHGNPWPIHFQSFNDYKPGLYVYIILPFVALFGLNEWAVRIPGAFLGGLTVLVVYYLVHLFIRHPGLDPGSDSNDGTGKRQIADQVRNDVSENLFPLLAAFSLAISPWHIHFSRGAWEVNVATFFITLGLLLFLRGFKSPINLIFAVISFALSLYAYHAARIIVPLLGVGLLFIYWKQLSQLKKYVSISAIIGVIVLLPLFFDLTGPAGISRASGVGLFADTGPLARINEQRGEHGDINSLSAKLLHNKGVNYGLAFVQNWMDHYNGNFLFLSGEDIQRNKVPGMGQTYLFAIATCIVGLYSIAKRISNFQFPSLKSQAFLISNQSKINKLSNDRKSWTIILWWFAIAPIAAALTFQSPHALRAQNMVIPFEIINAFGLYTLITWIYKRVKFQYLRFLIFSILFFAISVSFLSYLHMYYVHMAKEYPFSSQYGVKELVQFVELRQNDYQKVLVTDRYDQPYILFLFYMKYPPTQFQTEHTVTARDQYGFSTVRNFGKFHFWPIDFEASKRDYPNSLIAGTGKEIPKEANVVKKIYGTNGYLYFNVVAN